MESDFLSWLRGRLPGTNRAPLGLRDDAALLLLDNPQGCVLTTDLLMDGIDFELARCDRRRAGRKALAVNLSDLAAMAARPVAALVSLALPRSGGRQLAEELYEGLLPLAESFGVAIIGGDTNSWEGPLVISITAVGQATERGPLLRSGGLPGDAIVVTGQFGGSLLGRHFDFPPPVREALLLRDRYDLHAAIDVSDGLSLDLARLAAESGCGAVLDLAAVPIATAAEELARLDAGGSSALEHALGDGEDFELVLALPPGEAGRLLQDQPLDVALTRIGQLISQPGLWQMTREGYHQPLAPRGYEHGSTS